MLEYLLKSEPRTLERLCEEINFHLILNGNSYCSIGMARKVHCIYQQEKDENGIYVCLHPKFNENDYKVI